MVDFAAKVVFKWKQDGSFDRVIGKPGQGPGEFSFMSFGGPQGYLATQGGFLYVLDGAQKRIMKFDPDGTYTETLNVSLPTGRIAGFWMTNSGTFLLSQANFVKEVPTLEIVEVDATGATKIIYETPDKSFEREGEGARPTAIVLKVFGPGLFVRYDQLADALIYGNPVEPKFSVRYLNKGTETKEIEVYTNPRDVTQADIDEAKETAWIKNNNFFKVELPEKLSYFDQIMMLPGGRFFIFNQSWHLQNVEGYILDAKGKPLKRVFYSCGEGGGLYQSRGKILSIHTNEDGDFLVQEVVLK